MSNLTPTPEWDDVWQWDTATQMIGGSGTAPLNKQSQALLNRTALLANSRVIDSISALKAIDSTKHARVFVTGYYAAGDGGGGEYWLDNSDTSSADNGGTIIVAADNGRWKLARFGNITIRHFGASPTLPDNAAAIVACATAMPGWKIIVPPGVYSHSEIVLPKSARVHIEGEFSSYDDTVGCVLNYTGTGTSITVGVNDGNPDSTGPVRNVEIRGVTITTTTGATALLVQNSAMTVIEGNAIHGFSGKVILLHENVITRIRQNDIRGAQPSAGNIGIWLDTVQYFGNYVTDITDNHIYQMNWGIRIAGGRYLNISGNKFENMKGWTSSSQNSGGLFLFATAGYISMLIVEKNYCESTRGYFFYSDPASPFTGAVLSLVVRKNDFWGSGEAAYQNPSLGNLPRNKFYSHDVSDNLFVDAGWNNYAYLGLPSNGYFASTSIFDPATTVLSDQVTNKEYEDALVYALRGTDLLGSSGDLTTISSGSSIAISSGLAQISGGSTSGPMGWTANGVIAGAVWNAVLDAIGWVCSCPGSGSTFNLATITINIPSSSSPTYFALAFTFKGWGAVKLNGSTTLYDSGASNANYSTQVVKFGIPASTTSFTLTIATNATASWWSEMRLFKIGVAEYNEPGSLGGALTKAVRRLMKRGAY